LIDLPWFEFLFLAVLALVLLGPEEFVRLMRLAGKGAAYVRAHVVVSPEKPPMQATPAAHTPGFLAQPCTIHLALYQPEIPQNTGTLMRMGACLNVPIDVIEPCGFVWNDQKLRRAGMDYMDIANVTRHESWQAFTQTYADRRLVLLDTRGDVDYHHFTFNPTDVLLLGQESVGVPADVFDFCVHKVRIPMQPGTRSLNMAMAGALVVGEALRQCALPQG
jgi:tRNA (cytidine/uridine-2'-O-)-methyltransferase